MGIYLQYSEEKIAVVILIPTIHEVIISNPDKAKEMVWCENARLDYTKSRLPYFA